MKVMLPIFLLPKLNKMVTETLRFHIIFVSFRQKIFMKVLKNDEAMPSEIDSRAFIVFK